jgi:hypothetical protein
MNTYEDRELAREIKTLAGQIPIPAGTVPQARGSTVARAVNLAGAMVVLVAAVGVASAIANLRASQQDGVGNPAASSSAPPTAPVAIAFPETALLAGTSDGFVYRIEGGQISGAPVNVCNSQSVLGLRLSPTGRSVLVICWGRNDGQVMVLDSTTLARRAGPLPAMPRDDVAAWAPDELSIAVLQSGSCEPPAPVCSVHLVLWEIASGATRVIRPDETLTFNVRWTSLGLSVSFMQPPQPGTLVWDGQAWRSYSDRRLWIADTGGRALLVQAGAGSIGGQVWERQGTQERQLSVSPTDTEYPVALDGDRALVWRDQPPGGAMVIYRGQQIERIVPVQGLCSSAQLVDRWLICGDSGSAALAYSLDSNQFARQPITGLNRFNVLIPVPKKQ